MGKGKVKQALELAGSQHKYQYILVLLMALSWVQINFVLLGSTLIYMDPVFHCASTGDLRVQQAEACAMISQCELIDQFTLTAELQLYCQKQWARDIIQSVFSIGSFTGLIVMNLISDTKGRKISTVISLSLSGLGVLFAFLGGQFMLIPLLILAQFCGGFGAYAIVTLTYTLLSDFCSDSFRPRGVVFVNSAWGVSTLSLGVFYLIELNWFPFLLYMNLIPLSIVSFVLYNYLHESPYILMNQNKKQEALFVLIQIAKTNNRQQNIPQIKEIIETQEQRSEQKKPGLKNLVKVIRQWQYLKPILILTVIYGIGNINFYGISYSFDMEGLGFGYNSILAGIVEAVSFVYLSLAVNSLPRKKGISGFYTVVLIIGLLFLFPAIANNYMVGTALLGLSRVFSTVSYTLIACMQTQAFTVEIQSTAAGIIEAFSLYGALLAPLIVDMSDKIGINAVAIISICVSFAIWPPFFMKQTLIRQKKQKESQIQSGQNISKTLLPQGEQTPNNPQSSQYIVDYQKDLKKNYSQSTPSIITQDDY